MNFLENKTIRTRGFKLHKNYQDFIKSIVFFMCILMISLFCVINAYKYSGPVIIGSEMNTNGSIEYMCLGNSCEGLQNFTWKDGH